MHSNGQASPCPALSFSPGFDWTVIRVIDRSALLKFCGEKERRRVNSSASTYHLIAIGPIVPLKPPTTNMQQT
jgi:hypothetical protein